MKAPHTLVTPRLLLRRPVEDDVTRIFERYAADPHVTRYPAWPTHRSVDDTRAFIDFSHQSWQGSRAGPYLIEDQASGQLLGSTGFDVESDVRASTGYVLARDAWGHGYATEAVTALLMLASQLHLREIYAQVHAAHRASQRVLEKCGFQRDAACDRPYSFPNLGTHGLRPALCYAYQVPALR